MQAITFGGKEIVRLSEVIDPEIQNPADVIVEVTLSGICGSDLHVYHGRETGLDHGTVMGHEFTGVVVETGKDVKKIRKGTRVLSPFTTSCGECYYCLTGLTCRCVKGNLFGWVQNGDGLHGAQAAFVRVPMADATLIPLSNDLSEEKGLLLGDVFSTGYFCAENAGVNSKGIYVVIGCGPVGLMAVVAARHMGAETIFAIDNIPSRLKKAEMFGAFPLNFLETNIKDHILSNTDGRGADAVMEVVGSAAALRLAVEVVRPGGIISSAGVHTEKQFPFSPAEAYDKNLTYKIGRCPAHFYAEKLLREEIIQQSPVEEIITHRFEMKDGVQAYEIFDKKLDDCIKTVLVP